MRKEGFLALRHELAHVAVALHQGVKVERVVLGRDGSGRCEMSINQIRGNLEKLCRIGLAPALVDSMPSALDLQFFLDNGAPDLEKVKAWLRENRGLLLERIRELEETVSLEAKEEYYEVILGDS